MSSEGLDKTRELRVLRATRRGKGEGWGEGYKGQHLCAHISPAFLISCLTILSPTLGVGFNNSKSRKLMKIFWQVFDIIISEPFSYAELYFLAVLHRSGGMK